MTSREIRRQFLDFFASKEHKIIPSAPIVAKADPTLLFINSGMAPLKDFFLGNQTPPSKRVADTQKCLRVSGKHNDLEDVGFDGYHHTMFEMLGNWSFGDYFKKEAIQWSWELLTDYYKIPKDRLYVSVFKGDAAENLPFDQEAFDEWKKYVSEDRILAFGKKENFWEMGDQGPCGPCSEIHVDLRSDAERAKRDGRELVNADDPNVIEVWNNVFMQFNRKADRSLEELPAKSVDTGMGFERLCRAVQGVASNYDTDLWRPLFKFLSDYSGIAYTATYPGLDADWKKTDVAMRVVADHLRAVSFTIADGELPSNTGAGYVIRRILRRAVRYYYSFLDIKEPVLHRMAPILAEEFSDVFTELKAQIDFVSRVILEEEKSFLRTLESGLKRIENLEVQNNTVSGAQAFELFDTYGFPFDLTSLIAKEKGWMVDEEGFKAALQEQKERSRKDAAKEVGDWTVLNGDSDVEFVGYDVLEARSSYVLKYRTVTAKGQTQYQIVLNRTPFYPEGGGQVGDTGKMFFGTEEIKVLDTKKENTLVIHLLEKLPADLEAPVHCYVDARKRRLTENNHSATHLLHAALRQVLGTHVQQKGSYLDEQTLRFDFAHFQKVSEAEIAEIERIVNEKIRENIALEEARALPIEDARKAGAMMLFGEKYGESVRMITFDPAYSRELCGGCHVSHTGKIGYFKLTSESAVAAGVRRIEAVTAAGAEAYVGALELEVNAIKSVLKSRDLAKGVEALQDENKSLTKKRDELYQQKAMTLLPTLIDIADDETFSDFVFITNKKVEADTVEVLKTLSANLEARLGSVVIALAIEVDDKVQLILRISEDITKMYQLHAGKLIQEMTKTFLSGNGGGQPVYATGSGELSKNLPQAFEFLKDKLLALKPRDTSNDSKRVELSVIISENEISKSLMQECVKKPYSQDHSTDAWKYFTDKKSDEFIRREILKQGGADFSSPYKDTGVDVALSTYELVDLYCYYYFQMHYASSAGLFKIFPLEKLGLDNKIITFIDLGCGPMTSGVAFVEYLFATKPAKLDEFSYVGFDNAPAMIEKAEGICDYLVSRVEKGRYNFCNDVSAILDFVPANSDMPGKHLVIINLCYTLAGQWFSVQENLESFAETINRIKAHFQDQTILIMYQNPNYNRLHKNWEKLKELLNTNDFGNRHDRTGVINFTFTDSVGSWKNRPKPNRQAFFDFFWNETI